MICKRCGQQIGNDAQVCMYCGTRTELYGMQQPQPGRCLNCGAPLAPSARFCNQCGAGRPMGAPQPAPANVVYPTEKPRRRSVGTTVIIIVLCVFITAAALAIIGDSLGWFDVFNNDSGGPTREFDNGTPPPAQTQENGTATDEPKNSPEPEETPVAVPDNQQVIRVTPSGSTAVLTLECWENGEWTEVLTIPVYIGKNGTSHNKVEGDRCTPAGTFRVLYYLATEEVAGSKLSFVKVKKGDVWVCDTKSDKYNTLQSADAPVTWNKSDVEDLYAKFTQNRSVACIMFDYNGDGKTCGAYNRGTDIFIDGVGSKGIIDAGYGDIRMTAQNMYTLLSYLDSSKAPIIIIE